MTRYSSEELNTFSKEQLVGMYGDLQTELEKLNRNMESLQEQIRHYMLKKSTPGLINANCWVHARRDFADAVKAVDKERKGAIRQTVAWKALERIARMYEIENNLAKLTPDERLGRREKEIEPLVDEFFA